MPKSDPIEKALDAIGELRQANAERAVEELRSYLRNRSNLVVAKAAKVTAELHLSQLAAELVAAFDRLFVNPQKLDKRCAALTKIVKALYEFDYTEPEVYLRGAHHVQMEASFGPPVDAAASLRGLCAQGLLRTRYANAVAEVLPLLIDPEPQARLGAIHALALNGGEAGALLLRFKALTGDEDAGVLGECFAGLLAAAPEQSVSFVARYIDSDDTFTAEAAIWALGQSRQQAAFLVLKDKWERTVSREVRKGLLAALAALRLQESVEYLCAELRTADSQTAADLIVVLANYANNESVRQTAAGAVDERHDRALTELFKQHFAGS